MIDVTKSVYTLSRTTRSVPHAYFATYAEAKAYNAKYFEGTYIITEQYLTVMGA